MNTKRLIFLVPIVAAMAGLLLFQWIGATAAAPTSCTITVTNSNDSGAGSLRQAVADVCDGGTVTFDPTLDGQTVTLTNQITITRLITVTGETLDITISGNNATRHFEVTATGGLMLDRLTLRDGSADFGGSIFNQGNITITQTDLVSNTATGNGGALVNQGTATVEQTTFANNHSNERGGAIFTNGGTLTIRDSRIEVNSADFNGGAIRLAGGSNSAEISNTDILSNTAAQQGGAIFADVDSTLTLRESRVLGNMATGEGGALVNQGPTTIEQTTFAHNHSDNRGGAIFTDGGTLTIRDSRIEANSAGSTGGGIRLTSPEGQFNSAEINNTDIISNTAAQDGGAIFTFARSTLTLRDSRILGNTATGNGGALVNQGPATIEQTTFANNHSNERGGAIYRLGGTLTIRDSRIEANSADFNGGAIRLAGGNNSTEISNTDIISNTAAQQGGAIFADVNSTLTLRDSRVLGNTATSDGGALVTQRTATIEQTTFACNRSGNRGGAIFTDGGTLTMRDSRLEANRSSASGGAIRLSASSGSSISAEISNTDFISNTAALGGAISSDENSTLTLRDSRVLGNTAAPASGGALFTQGSTTIEQTTFADNHTAGVGGAIGASNGTLVIRDSRLEANSADIFGGAIGLLASSGQSISAEISNTDILGNTTAQRGGAIFSDDDSTLTLRDSRVFSNTATGNGGGLHNQGPATVEQTTFANNHSDDRGGAIFTDGGTLTMRDSHI